MFRDMIGKEGDLGMKQDLNWRVFNMLETVFENFEFETAVVEPRFRDETTFI